MLYWFSVCFLVKGDSLHYDAQRLQNMKAIRLTDFGGPEAMVFGDAETPRPGAGEILIKVVATSVNRPDVMQREGHYPPPSR